MYSEARLVERIRVYMQYLLYNICVCVCECALLRHMQPNLAIDVVSLYSMHVLEERTKGYKIRLTRIQHRQILLITRLVDKVVDRSSNAQRLAELLPHDL